MLMMADQKGEKMKDYTKNMNWAVAYKIDKRTQDDRKTKIVVVATFSTPINAEDFINFCMPKENKNNFFIIEVKKLDNCTDADKVQKITSMYADIIE